VSLAVRSGRYTNQTVLPLPRRSPANTGSRPPSSRSPCPGRPAAGSSRCRFRALRGSWLSPKSRRSCRNLRR
jgi:hypothetical protein